MKLRALAEKYGGTVTWQPETRRHGKRAQVLLNGSTKYYTAYSGDADKAYLGSDGNMYVDDSHFYNQWGIVHNNDSLLTSLSGAVDTYKNVWQTIGTALYNTNAEALNIVLSYNETIECAAAKYGIDKAMVQSILFQEIRFLNLLDEVDTVVLMTYQYYQDLEDYPNWPWYTQLLRGTPTPPLGARTDSSTGLGQIFASTAIAAINWYSGQKYDASDWKDLREVWTSLKYDDQYNINMVALVLAHKKSILQNEGIKSPTPQDIMQRYNGTGDLSVSYRNVTGKYYEAFRQYNVEN